ncbi:flagellar biosynthesis anti-sigma factor FlgM [Camelliibacillus cellulosilyticus]|uniref:Negative regulator of flagellin synthesis n=1 Tax=Camelliibacillus cellulosilyticus TaxID=2174486 RepID=A0ABV9GPG7_9BACL
MKIDHTHHIHNVNPYQNRYERPAMQEQMKADGHDRVDISPEARKLQTANPIESARADKIETLKNQIDNGQYRINHRGVAEKFMAYWQSIGGIRNDDSGNR